jgi:hypothetical protein
VNRHAPRRRDPHRELHGGGAQLADVGAALLDRAVRRSAAILAERKKEVNARRLAGRGTLRELAGALDRTRERVGCVVGDDARGLQEDLDIEPSLAKEIRRNARTGRDRGEQVPRRGALTAALREILGKLA